MSLADIELTKMVRGFRVSELITLLTFARGNKIGKKHELQNRVLDILKSGFPHFDMKIKELHRNRCAQTRGNSEAPDMYSMAPLGAPVMNYNNRSPRRDPMRGPGMSSYVLGMEKHFLAPPAHLSVVPQYPVNPEVKFKELPFYDVLAELLKPTSLVGVPADRYQERNYMFCFTPQQMMEFQTGTDVEVQVRLCVLDTSCEQDDELPTSICLKINEKTCPVPTYPQNNRPGVEPKRPRNPIDITTLTKKTATEQNQVFISWTSISGKPYVLGIFLVRKQTSDVLIRRLKDNGVRNPDHTTAMIKEKLCQDRDSEIATMSLRGSLMCPLGKIKMNLPCRALTCTHLQCFDATLYLQMNEKKPKWICPVCDKPAFFKNLAIDGLFLDIAIKAPFECTEVQFHEDGSWTPVMPVKKQTEINDASFEALPKVVRKVDISKPKKPIEVISLDSDSDSEESWPFLPPKKKMFKPSSESSPVLLESPEDTRNCDVVTVKSCDPFTPGSSKSEASNSKILPLIPDKSSLLPLPDSLDIDTSDIDCILGTSSSILSGPSTSGYEDMSPASPPKTICPPTAFSEIPDILQSTSNGNRHFNNFDLFSLITPSQGDSCNFLSLPSPSDEERSPDIINID